jgi:hypothetical protein
MLPVKRSGLWGVILSETKDLARRTEILRFTQDDKVR